MWFKKIVSGNHLKKTTVTSVTKMVESSVKEPTFGGIPLSKLSDLARQCYHGLG